MKYPEIVHKLRDYITPAKVLSLRSACFSTFEESELFKEFLAEVLEHIEKCWETIYSLDSEVTSHIHPKGADDPE